MKDTKFIIISNQLVAEGIYEMWLQSDKLEHIVAGQFISIETCDNACILRRPFCIADVNYNNNSLRIIYQLIGEGTKSLSKQEVGQSIMGIYPLGRGFNIEQYDKIMLIGGGMGTVLLPMIMHTNPNKKFYSYMGFKNSSKLICVDEVMNGSEELTIVTELGDVGEQGYVTDVVASSIAEIKPDAILCCGPEVMYKALERVVDITKIPTLVSLERRMGCGIGACLVCNCKLKTRDGFTYKRACKEGPVFELKEIEL